MARWADIFFFNDTATTEIYTLSLHDALPISLVNPFTVMSRGCRWTVSPCACAASCASSLVHSTRIVQKDRQRSEEHTSELQSQSNLVCRLLLEKKNQRKFAIARLTNLFTAIS